jgi:hypothetical protein
VGDNQGSVKLYKYPCSGERVNTLPNNVYKIIEFSFLQPESHVQKKYTGHVSCVRFTSNDCYLITSGGQEAAVMQWSIVNDDGRR